MNILRRVGKFLAWMFGLIAASVCVLLMMDALHTPTCLERPAPGTVISIPGEEIVILEPAVTSEDGTLVLDVVRDPFDIKNYSLPPEHGHIHPNQEERFEVVSGRARFLIGDEYHDLGPGEVGVVPPNTVHHWMALDDAPVRVTAYFEPSLNVDMWFLHFQKHIADDTMDLLQAAVIAREYWASSPAPVDPPPAVWSFVARVLAPVGRLAGYTACEK